MNNYKIIVHNQKNNYNIIYKYFYRSDIMEITKNYDGNELTMSVAGEIDTFTASDLENEINSEMDTFDSLILDFEKVEYISSCGLRILILTKKKLQPRKKKFKIINASEIIKDIFSESGFDKILDIE